MEKNSSPCTVRAGEQLEGECTGYTTGNYGGLDQGCGGKDGKKWSQVDHSEHRLNREPIGLYNGFLEGCVQSRKGITNDLCFVLQHLEGWTCYLLRWRRLM
jgi:hypothetical protein